MARYAGIDCLLQAFSGFAGITGARGGKGEMMRYEGHLDLNSGTHIAAAVLQALLMRQSDGKGRRVDVTMLGSALKHQASRLAEFFASGAQPVLLGSESAATVPHRAFRCRDGRWITVGVVSEAQWRRLCLALGRPELQKDPRFHTNAQRVASSDQLYVILEERIASSPYRWWELQFTRHRVPHGPNLDFSSILAHREIAQYLKVVDHPTRGPYYTGAMPFHFSKTPLDGPWTNADPLEPSMTLEAAFSYIDGDGDEDGRSG